MPILNVSSGFISTWKKIFFQNGVEGLKLAYKGSKGFLDKHQHAEIIEWLQTLVLLDFKRTGVPNCIKVRSYVPIETKLL